MTQSGRQNQPNHRVAQPGFMAGESRTPPPKILLCIQHPRPAWGSQCSPQVMGTCLRISRPLLAHLYTGGQVWHPVQDPERATGGQVWAVEGALGLGGGDRGDHAGASGSVPQGLLEQALVCHLVGEGHHQAAVLLHGLGDDLIGLPVP